MSEQQHDNLQITQIRSARSTRPRGWIITAAVFLVTVLAAVIVFTLPYKSSAERLEEALGFGEKYLSELNYEQAIASWQLAIEIDPKCLDAYLGLAESYIAMGDYIEAEKTLARAEKILADRQRAGEDVSVEMERLNRKMEELEALIRQKEEEKEALLKQQREEEAAQRLSQAEQYLFAAQYDSAIREFTELLEMTPDRKTAYLGAADACLHLEKNADAAELIEDGIQNIGNKNFASVLEGIDKSSTEGYIAIAEAFEAEDLHERALELLERVYRETGNEIIGRKLGIVEASRVEYREDYAIEWKDAEFERLIRDYLGKATGDIRYNDVKEIEEIHIWADIIGKPGERYYRSYSDDWFWLSDGREGAVTGRIRTLEDLEHFTGLKQLEISYQEAMDISALANTDTIDCLLRLERLALINDGLSDISALSGLSALKSIDVMYNRIEDISPLAMLIELTDVSISNNRQLVSAEPLGGLRKLNYIGLSSVEAVDLEIFCNLPELRRMSLVGVGKINYHILPELKLYYLEISCDDEMLSAVCRMKTLKELRLHGRCWNRETFEVTPLTSIEGIGALDNLTKLDLLAPDCHDISPISSLNIEILELELPADCDLTPLKSLKKLKTVIIPSEYYAPEDDTGSRMLEQVRKLLPGIEVRDTRH